MKKNKDKNLVLGFTLIELLVVISIIGILSAIVLNGLSGSRERTRDAVRLGDLKSLAKSAEVYFTEHNGQFPATLSDMNQYFTDNAVPKDPKTHTDYSYKSLTSPKGYCFGAVMELETMRSDESCDSGGTGDNYKIKGP